MKNKIRQSIIIIIYTIVVALIGVGATYWYTRPQPASPYSKEVQWVIDNPTYAEKLYKAHETYIKTAENALSTELDNVGGASNQPTPEPTKKLGK